MAHAMSTVSLADVAGVLLNDKALFSEWFFLYNRLGVNSQGLQQLVLAYTNARTHSVRSSFTLIKSIIYQWALLKGSDATVHSLANILKAMQHGVISDELLGKFPNDPIITTPWSLDVDSVAAIFRRHLDENGALPHVDELIQRKTRGGVKILDFIKDPQPGQSRILIYTTHLVRILSSPEVQDIPVAIVSINGKKRGGKSFLMNQCVKYLLFGHLPNNQWMNVELENSFEWRNSNRSVTCGIQVWYDPIVLEISGKKIAVVLVDTQGLYDSHAGSEDNAMIFSLSSLISSVFIYNEKCTAAEDSLQTANFLECAKFISSDGTNALSGSSRAPVQEQIVFQKLVLLLRDFECEEEYPFGYYDNKKSPPNLMRDKYV